VSPPAALLVIPTHDHAARLPYALRCAQEQTIEDIQIVVIGDGVGDDTRDAIAPVLRNDPRVQFLDRPKAGRTGEPHRHAVVSQTDAPIVGYLGDDDLMAPDHVATMIEALASADVAASIPTNVAPDGTVHWPAIDDREQRWVEAMTRGARGITLTRFTHTAEAYRRLPEGWATTPTGWPTDVYMFLKFATQPWCRVTRPDHITTLKFVSLSRTEMSEDERNAEMKEWAERLSDSAGWDRLRAEAKTAFVRDASMQLIVSVHLQRALEQREAELTALRSTRSLRLRERLLSSRILRTMLARRRGAQ
jgi:glycosyltransferase involved in cell wall biosynthesis